MPDAPMIQGWVRWFDRDGFDGIDCPGVYLIARFESGHPDESVNPADEHVVYIGETCRTLRERLRAFNRVAHDGKSTPPLLDFTYNRLCDAIGSSRFICECL